MLTLFRVFLFENSGDKIFKKNIMNVFIACGRNVLGCLRARAWPTHLGPGKGENGPLFKKSQTFLRLKIATKLLELLLLNIF